MKSWLLVFTVLCLKKSVVIMDFKINFHLIHSPQPSLQVSLTLLGYDVCKSVSFGFTIFSEIRELTQLELI